MSYWLGIDVGTTFTAAAICRDEVERCAFPEVVPLGSRSAAVSSVIYLGEDGHVVVGEAAERRAVTDPGRVVREFKRRIGDEVPMVIGGVPHSAPEIAALVVRWVVDRVAQREDEPAQGITITHPASWGAYKIRIMRDALGAASLPEIRFCTEPEAAAASYSIQERIDVGSTIAVYDLGGGTFDAAVVRKTGAATFSVLGLPEGIERLGGVDFDDAVFRHVVAAVPALSELDPEAPATLAATARLRRECTEAKEALSADTEVTIPVLLPGVQSEVRLVRAEFEDLIRPQVVETVEALRRALRSAGVGPEDLDVVLLVGGSSRVPLVAQLVSAELGRPVAVDADPKAAIALGAARSGVAAGTEHPADAGIASAHVPLDASAPTAVDATSAAGLSESDILDPAGEPVPAAVTVEIPHRPSMSATPLDVEPAEVEWRRARSRRIKQFTAAGLLALVLVGGAASVPFLTAHSGPVPPADAGTPAPALPAATTTPAPNVEHGGEGGPPLEDSGGSGGGLGADSIGAVRTTPSATPSTAAGAVTNPEPPPAPPPPTTWTTTYNWTTRWSSPPASTTNNPPQPTTTPMPPPPTTTTTTTTRPPPTTTTTTVAPAPTTVPPTTNSATTSTAPGSERSDR